MLIVKAKTEEYNTELRAVKEQCAASFIYMSNAENLNACMRINPISP